MKARNRFLKSVISAAKSETTTMPWSRGTPRSTMLRNRTKTKLLQETEFALKRA
ncbi:hypothetical protein [Roseobacter sp. SK209-2-6]|uniref:hypothetical protein n=1 Tax=Roseobacter sp. SK209-2-6 TaxID=388739 RepID=UPI0018DAFE04|nr:hypothetical protein [Roseobacter sp. SK209-2-6]